MKKAPQNIKFVTSFHENRPVTLADRSFWSKRLTGEEEQILQVASMEDLSPTVTDVITGQISAVRHILQGRVRDGQALTDAWVAEHVGKSNAEFLLSYFRTGQGLAPGDDLNLPSWGEIQIDDRTFTGRAVSYAEALRAAQRTDEHNATRLDGELARLTEAAQLQEGESIDDMLDRLRKQAMESLSRTQDAQRLGADNLAEALNTRIADEGPPITGQWLMSVMQLQDITNLAHYLRAGEIPEEEDAQGEEDAPNAEGA